MEGKPTLTDHIQAKPLTVAQHTGLATNCTAPLACLYMHVAAKVGAMAVWALKYQLWQYRQHSNHEEFLSACIIYLLLFITIVSNGNANTHSFIDMCYFTAV